MFEYIFNRGAAASTSTDIPAPESASQSALQKQAAIELAQGLQDESASVDFILHCPFADARLIAAANVVSQDSLELVWQATRNTDRRVAKLMHGRLDEIKQRALSRRQAQQCIDDAQRLAQEPRLLANQVVDLDHAWQTILLVAEDQGALFAAVRAQLGARLETQATLQHDVIEIVARLRHMLEHAEFDVEAANLLLVGSAEAMAQHRDSPEAVSLPAHLLSDFTHLHERLAARLATPVIVAPPEPAMAPAAAAEPKPVKSKRTPVEQDPALRSEFETALAGLEKSLQDGALHAAAEFDRRLRAPGLQAFRPGEAQTNHLAGVRAELARLQGWARWGGNVSREELLKAAQSLAGQTIAPAELAKKVGSLREHWKALDGSAGPVSKDLWHAFDAACTTAYAPAAAHFKRLSEEREHNLAKAQGLIEELRQFVGALPAPDSIDWKKLALYDAHITQAWQRLGAMERKEKKRLDGEFAQALQALAAPLTERRAGEVKAREQLIREVAELNPNQRGALETLRALQERWQTQARSLPLERKVEQALWKRFRAACDVAFAARKEGAVAADADRRVHQQAKEDLCSQLEAAGDLPENAVGKLMRDVREAWSKAGHVPRAVEKQIEQRYQAAQAMLQKRLDNARKVARQAEAHALLDKVRLCQQAEAALLQNGAPDASLEARWTALPALAATFERGLRARFEAAGKGDAQYVALLKKNQALLEQELLRCEIGLQLDSPAELARDRLKLQVEVLQSSLKAGQKPQTAEAQLIGLCSLAALTDAREVKRLERIIEAFVRSAHA